MVDARRAGRRWKSVDGTSRSSSHAPLRVAALALVVLAALAVRTPASAHAPLIRAEPAPGTELGHPPARLVLTFAEPIDGRQSYATLFHAGGNAVSGVTSLPAQPSPVDMIVTLPENLAPDEYTVSWFTLSAVDGHTRRGSYTFTVLEPDGSRPPAAAAPVRVPSAFTLPGWVDVAGKLAAILGAILLAGAAVFAAIAAPVRATSRADWTAGLTRRLVIAVIVGAGLVILGSAEQLASPAVAAGGWDAVRGLLGDRFGRWLLARGALALLAAALTAVFGGRMLWERWPRAALLITAGVILFSLSFLSHAAAGSGRVWGTLADLVHLAAAAVWIGALANLAAVLLLDRRGLRDDPPSFRRLLGRFSTVAAVSVGLLLVTGTVNALIEVPNAGALTGTAYGRLLLLKLALAAVLLAVAAANAFVLRPRVAEGRGRMPRFRRLVVVEVIAAVAVLAATAALSLRTPARSALEHQQLVSAASTSVNPVNSFSGQGLLSGQPLTLTLVPGRLGPNYVEAEIGGRLQPAELLLTLAGPSGAVEQGTLQPGTSGGHPAYTGSIEIDGAAGTWTATVSVPGGVSARLAVPLIADQETTTGGAFASPAPQVPAAGWALLMVAGLAALAVLAWKPLTARLSPMVTAFAIGQALVIAVALAFLVATETEAGPAGPAWGATTRVTPHASGGYTTWQVPSRDGYLMIPGVGPDGQVWVGEMGINKLAGLNPAANTYLEFTFPIARLAVTMGATVDASNRVWLAQDGTHGIASFDPATGSYLERPTPTPNSSPFGITVDGRGRVWFTEMGAHKLGVYDPAAGAFTEYPLPDPSVYPYWLGVAPDGRVWFTALTTGSVGVLDPSTGSIEMIPVPDATGTTGLDIDAGGDIWFGIRGSAHGTIVRLDPATGQQARFDVPNGDAYGVAVAQNGLVWVATTHTAVDAFDPKTRRFCPVTTGDGSWWVTAGPDGSVWVVEGVATTNALGRISPELAANPCR